jgi:hypothetical protein
VLEGQAALGPDDVDDALTKAQQRAEDLETTVASLLDTARYAADWRTRESVLGWTEDAYRDAKAITKELRSHITLVEVRGCGRGGGGAPPGGGGGRARTGVSAVAD